MDKENEERQAYRVTSTRFYESKYPYTLTCEMQFQPGYPEYNIDSELVWEFTIFNHNEIKQVWKGTLQELVQGLLDQKETLRIIELGQNMGVTEEKVSQ